MEISVIEGGAGQARRRDLHVTVDGDVELADVLTHVAPGWHGPVAVDRRHVDPRRVFVDVCRPGSVVAIGGAWCAAGGSEPLARGEAVRVVGGLRAGATHAIGPRSEVVVGRSPQADIVIDDPTVSPFHLRLRRSGVEWIVEDLGSHNGTAVDGRPVDATEPVGDRIIHLGATSIAIGAASADLQHVSSPGPDGLTPFNRPPRPAGAPEVDPIAVPDPPAERRRGAAFSAVALLGPIIIGAVMVQVLGSMRYALFAVLGPVMMITSALATRRRNTKDAKSSARRFAKELVEFGEALARGARDEAAHRARALPDVAQVVERVDRASVRLWERRARHPDHLVLRVGLGSAPWQPPVDTGRVAAHPDLRQLVADHGRIERSPVELRLGSGAIVGVVGDRHTALAVARSLITQTAVLHGPADIGVAVLAAEDRADDWAWATWLPHVRAGEGRLLARGVDEAAQLIEAITDALKASSATGPTFAADETRRPPLLVVVDGDELTTARRAPARQLLAGEHCPVAGLVLADSEERLPSSCTAVIRLDGELGAAVLHDMATDVLVEDLVVDGLAIEPAERAARGLARFADPELQVAGGAVPARCDLLHVLGIEPSVDGRVDRAVVSRRTRAHGDDGLRVVVGAGEDGPVEIDLVADGPHALVGGTTGAGKSEFLRSLVAGLACRYTPDDLVFVLVDYKGGSAFDACADLPHTVGLVTDLDGHLAERALRSLEAELHHREQVLRAVGAADLRAYRGIDGGETLPRLVVVVDEFATLAAELPEFLSSLVGIAQRGRSLGVHMVLATQRPAGVVNADIKANTNIRVALRMQDDRDSADVIDGPEAAGIDRRTPGRAFIRLGPGELITIQTPLSSGPAVPAGPAITVAPFAFGAAARPAPAVAPDGPTALDALVEAIGSVHESTGAAAPRRPWVEMPTSVAIDDLGPDCAGGVSIALADDPDRQRLVPATWDPGEGHVALLGAVGSGTSTALRSVTMTLVRGTRAVHLYGVDYDGGLAGLDALDTCGAVIEGHDHERQRRLVDLLRAEVERRRSSPAPDDPQIVLLVDDLPAWLADHADAPGQDLVDDIRRLFAEGPSVGLAVAFTASRAAAVPMRLWGAVASRFLFRHADPDELTSTGLRRTELPTFVVGRAVDAATRLVVQFPTPCSLDPAHGMGEGPPPMPVEALPAAVPMTDLVEGSIDAASSCWNVPIGISADDRSMAHLPIRAGEGVLIAGPAGSGVSTALEMIARQVRHRVPGAVIVAVADDRSPLPGIAGLFDAVGAMPELTKVLEVASLDDERPWLVLMDDAHLHDEPGALEPLLRTASRCRLVVGGRADHLHGSFGHWTRAVRRSATGVLLHPRLDADGDLLGVRLPRHVSVPLRSGRGFLVSGADAELVQLAS